MTIIMHISYAAPHGEYVSGHRYEVKDEVGTELVKAGLAVEVKAPAAKK